MTFWKKLFYSTLALGLLATNVQAKRFTNQYSQFELPPGWGCALEGTEWVCQSENKDRKKEAIIILAAKIRGNQDSLEQYQAYLKGTKTFTLPGGKTQVSEPVYSKKKSVNSQQWIDSLHLASEVPGFYTRYMATVKADLGVAVTFSVGKDHYNSYKPVFDKIIETLRVFRQKKDSGEWTAKTKSGSALDNADGLIDDGGMTGDISARRAQKSKSGSGGAADYLIYIVIAAAAGFVLMKLKSGKKGKKKKKKKSKKS
ncbi:hypothetical protein BIY24_07765 [Halobacteriovorax marinus]|uniref:hypothetical protein n=1 Tax=Halobacteriovorax marinus TaxID=97084 RepID=UPI000BC3576E|nr:hypothetical protein [Halobacteriovorax marinus]ATH07849.1 hypothetical protein BIY24_07765 [Halobacteriovorax marinus]